MNHPADVIEALENTSGRLDKEAIIQRAWDAGITEFFVGAQLALDALVTFGVKKVPLIEEDDGQGSMTWQEFVKLSTALQTRRLSGNSARDALRAAAESAGFREWNLWYRRLLLKDLKCGVTEATVNKVLKANGKAALRYAVPVFSCQLAKPADDHPKKMTGPKLLDGKYDGVRLLSVLDKSTGTVSQFSRDGRANTNFGHITDALAQLIPHLQESVVLDGEVISSNFQALMRQLNRKDDVNTTDSTLVLFDIIPLGAFREGRYDVGQRDRHLSLCELMPLLDQYGNGALTVEPKMEVDLDTEEGRKGLAEFNRATLDRGLEGILIKDPDAPYQTKRTDAWLKMKPFETFDLEVVGVDQGTPGSKFENTAGAVRFAGVYNGKTIEVSVGSGWTDQDRDQIWEQKDNIIGQIGEIKGDVLTIGQNASSYSMRFPVFVRWRGFSPGEKI